MDDLEKSQIIKQRAPEIWKQVVKKDIPLAYAYTLVLKGVRDMAGVAKHREKILGNQDPMELLRKNYS